MKNKILEILNKHHREFISGEEICKLLDVSRTAIWKNIKKLQEDGYQIESSTNKGYCLKSIYDPIDPMEIKKNLSSFYQDITLVEEVDSTNEEMKRNALSYQEGNVLISNKQSKGKGRNGRIFNSPKHHGIYMSLFLRPNFPINQSLKITACVSCALYDAIKKVYNLDSSIKWVNDIFLENKKICGILCEASLEMNTASLEYMIIGIGVNVHAYPQPQELQDIAGSIEDFTNIISSRNALIHEILTRFYFYYKTMDETTFLPVYKQHSYVLNKEICVSSQNQTYYAKALDIDENASLIIAREDGTKEILNSGEITIRVK